MENAINLTLKWYLKPILKEIEIYLNDLKDCKKAIVI